MKTPEKIAEDFGQEFLVLPRERFVVCLSAVLRAYGHKRAAEMRERCAVTVAAAARDGLRKKLGMYSDVEATEFAATVRELPLAD